MSEGTHKPRARAIKSFVLRQGRLTPAQGRAIEALAPSFVVAPQDSPVSLDAVFGRAAATILEIGFGMGEATWQIAQMRPLENFLCCEVHTPGVGALLRRIGESGVGNIRIIQHDATEVIARMIADETLSGVHIFFPDPWHKKRHHKRRLIQSPFIAQLLPKLKSGGYIHVATDWQPYAMEILQILQAQTQLRNVSARADGYADKPPYRPLTKFERRGLGLGHGVWDMVFCRS